MVFLLFLILLYLAEICYIHIMPTISNDIHAAASALRHGKLVAFATETVYGLGGDADNAAAVAEIYRVKQRPPTHPLIVHVADVAAMRRWVSEVPPAAEALAQRYMPGALTLLLPPAAGVLPSVRGGEPLIALRAPQHPLANALLREFGGGIAAPSANRFGGISPTTAAHVAAEFPHLAELTILDGGDCTIGIESTIVGFADNIPFIVRPGRIQAADIAAVTGMSPRPSPLSIRAPGMLARHYAPQTPLKIGTYEHIERQCRNGDSPGVLSRQKPPALDESRWRQAAVQVEDYAHDLYRLLRELDDLETEYLIVEQPPDEEEWAAVNDRLQRAATATE